MAENLSASGSDGASAPGQIINLLSQVDIDYWCRIFGVDPAQLREAVHHAGHQAADVARYLRGKGYAGTV
jgi:hypothetical protein